MSIVRNLAIWLGAPLVASAFCTLVWAVAFNRPVVDPRFFLGVGLFSFIISMAGSACLSLLYRGMTARAVATRYAVLVAFGAVAGFLAMSLLGGGQAPLIFTVAGPIYGTTTACCWVGLHSTFHNSR